MASDRLNELTLSVRTKILERISSTLDNPDLRAQTQYTKSDGTNYGMYQKADPNLTDVWDTVINQRGTAPAPQVNVRPQGPA